MQPMFDKKHIPMYAWLLAGLAVPLLCLAISMGAHARGNAVLSRSHIVANQPLARSTISTQTDYIAQANDWILAREYRRWASIAGSMIQPLSFACILIGVQFAPRMNGNRLPWSPWLVLVILVAFASSRVTGTFAADRISDQIDLMQAKVWLGAASQSEIDPLRTAQGGVNASLRAIERVYLYCMLALLPVVFVQAIIYRWPERARSLPSEVPITN